MSFKTVTKFYLFILIVFGLSTAAIGQEFFTEDFTTEIPADWTSVEVVGNGTASSVWIWSDEGPLGPFMEDPIASTSGGGWILFDSDLNCNDPAGQDAWLISPLVDGTDKIGVFLQFETYYRSFNDRPQIRVGTDINDMTNWETYEVFPGIEANDPGGSLVGDPALNPQLISINISNVAAGNQFYFAFQFLSSADTGNGGNLTGCGYSWQVDDVKLLEDDPLPAHDLLISQPRLAPNFQTPASQVDTINFGFTVANVGAEDQTNVEIEVEIEGDNGDTYSVSDELGTVLADSTSILVFDSTDFFIPNGQTGLYSLTYTLTQDSVDAFPGNNSVETFFVVSDNTFAKDDNVIANATQPLDISTTWEIGSYFYIPNGGYRATEAVFSVASNGDAHQGQEVTVFLYEIDEDDDPGEFTDEDVDVVGFGTYAFTNEANFDVVTVELSDLLTGEAGIELAEGGEYFIMVAYEPDMFVPFSEINYEFQVATVVKNDGWFLGGFGAGTTAQVRMNIDELVGTNEVELSDTQLNLFPNPTADHIAIDLALEETSDEVELRIFNLDGKVLLTKGYENIKQQQLTVDVSNFPNGTYIAHIRTAEGTKAKKFFVQQ